MSGNIFTVRAAQTTLAFALALFFATPKVWAGDRPSFCEGECVPNYALFRAHLQAVHTWGRAACVSREGRTMQRIHAQLAVAQLTLIERCCPAFYEQLQFQSVHEQLIGLVRRGQWMICT